MKYALALALVVAAWPTYAQEIQKFSFSPAPEMERADLYAIKTVENPVAVLVLCPGRNHDGAEWIKGKAWQDFAKEHRLGLIGISFISSDALMDQGKGYPCAAKGSGQILLDAVRKIYRADLPLLMYGFSAGAVFANQFVDWKPERVVCWCAYAGDFGAQSKHDNSPPGIIACGEDDGAHYGASLSYFKNGRALGKPWLWVSVGKWDHLRSPALEDFARNYYDEVLNKANSPCWVDVDLKKEILPGKAAQIPSVSGWLPGKGLLEAWLRIHEP